VPQAARPVLVTAGKTSMAVYDREEEAPEEDLSTIALKNAPPWLISAVFHMLLMIILGVVFLPGFGKAGIELETVWAEKLGEQLDINSPFTGPDEDDVEDLIITPPDLAPVIDPLAAPPLLDPDSTTGINPTSTTADVPIGLALKGRTEGMRQALLGNYGGNAITEKAVVSGLEWLVKYQQSNGAWSLKGPYSNGAFNENEVAATAMALLAFQGHGVTYTTAADPKDTRFIRTVQRGWDWLLTQQDSDGNFFHTGAQNQPFYTNAQCTIALCELYAMTRDEKLREKLREPAQRAVDYLVRCQSPQGGWRYSPGGASDVSVTGWVVMALQSARMGYLGVPEDNLRQVERFLDNVGSENGTRYPYLSTHAPSVTMTAEALLCRQYLGWSRDDPRLIDGVEYITRPENLIDYRRPNVYYWYYATQVCHHMEGEYWKRWNDVMRQAVPEQQVKEGREAGSWDPGKSRRGAPYEWHDSFTGHGGRLYVTCLSIYMLEVYYRHLPLYNKMFR
jgi:hypothetical protein